MQGKHQQRSKRMSEVEVSENVNDQAFLLFKTVTKIVFSMRALFDCYLAFMDNVRLEQFFETSEYV